MIEAPAGVVIAAMLPIVQSMCTVHCKLPTMDLSDPEHGLALMQLGINLILAILADEALCGKRRYHFVEIFAGHAKLSEVLTQSGFLGVAFDRLLSKDHDIVKLPGFVLAGVLVGLIVPGGLAWMAPQCSSWLSFLCAFYMKRKAENDFVGDTARRDVREANATMNCLCFIICMAAARDVRICLENPRGSFAFKWRPLVKAAWEIGALYHSTYGGGLGWSSLKPIGLLSTLPARVMERIVVSHEFSMKKILSQPLGSKQLTKLEGQARLWVNGGKATKASEQYTVEFAEAVRDMLLMMFQGGPDGPECLD